MPEQGDDFGVMTGAERMLELAEQVIGLKDDSPMIRQMKMEMRYIKGCLLYTSPSPRDA